MAVEVIGNKVRTEILRQLSQRSMTSQELAEQLNVHTASIHRHLAVLEESELVSTDVGAGRRRGQTVIWSTNRDKIAQIGALWIKYVTGQA